MCMWFSKTIKWYSFDLYKTQTQKIPQHTNKYIAGFFKELCLVRVFFLNF